MSRWLIGGTFNVDIIHIKIKLQVVLELLAEDLHLQGQVQQPVLRRIFSEFSNALNSLFSFVEHFQFQNTMFSPLGFSFFGMGFSKF